MKCRPLKKQCFPSVGGFVHLLTALAGLKSDSNYDENKINSLLQEVGNRLSDYLCIMERPSYISIFSRSPLPLASAKL